MKWIALTFGTAAASAIFPPLNLETYLVALMLARPELAWWLIGPVAAAGQMLGKMPYYYGARGSLRLPGWLHRKTATQQQGTGRWARWMVTFQRNCQQRPAWTAGALLVSATFGIPPFAATSVAAGLGKAPVTMFVAAGFAGKTVRYSAVAAAPGLLAHLPWL